VRERKKKAPAEAEAPFTAESLIATTWLRR
jgi:hypothetical protein